jgi:hypothetical protein
MAAGLLRSPVPGEYRIEYSDNTHSKKDEWTPLLTVVPELAPTPMVGSEEAQAYYSLRVIQSQIPSDEKKAADAHARSRTILDALTQCLVRTNILRPEMTSEALVDVYQLSRARAVVLVPDTNALSTGTLHWLLEALNETQVWLLPVVVSLVQVQQRDALLKACVNKRDSKNLSKALRSRQLINASLSLLERHRERYQVLEVDPQLLRYVRPAGAGSSDPDEGDVLEDRLLIEAIHSALRATRSRAEKRVVTSDLLMARMLRAEGLRTLFLQTPSLPRGDIPCLRYEPLAKAFVGASLLHLLWELAHTFSSIRLVLNGESVVSLDAYWAAKTASDWADERMLISYRDEAVNAAAAPPSKEMLEDTADLDLSASAEVQGGTVARREEADLPVRGTEEDLSTGSFSRAPLPEVAFPQVVRLAAAVGGEGGTIDEIRARIAKENRPSADISRSAAEVLVRSSLVALGDMVLHPTEKLGQFLDALSKTDLDSASRIFSAYPAYRSVIEILGEAQAITVSGADRLLSSRLGAKPSREGNERLWRVAVYLGQAWSDGPDLRDGTSRPDQEVVRKVFLGVFDELAQDGLCALSELLPAFCRRLRISPWYAQQVIQTLVVEDRLSELSFQPSAGKRLNARDQVITLHHGEVRVVSSPIDRLDIGGRPVFTVLRGGAS